MPITAKRKKSHEEYIRRPFDPRHLKRGRDVAARYKVTLWREDGHWYGNTIEEPGANGDGRSAVQAIRAVRQSAAILVAYLIESGEPVITPIVDLERQRKAG